MKKTILIGGAATLVIVASVATNVVVLKQINETNRANSNILARLICTEKGLEKQLENNNNLTKENLKQIEKSANDRLAKIENKVNSFQPHNINISEHQYKTLAGYVVNANGEALKSLTDSVKNLEKAQKETQKELVIIKNSQKETNSQLNAAKTEIVELKNERQKKAEMYLNAARTSVKNPEIAQMLYVSALTYSENKAVILAEFITWQTNVIKQILQKNNIDLAQKHFAALAKICDTHIAWGSINDMLSIPQLQKKLAMAKQAISVYQDTQTAEYTKQINAFAEKIKSVSTYEMAETLLKELSDLQTDPSFDDLKESIAAKIIMKQSCLTTPSHQLMIPVVSEDTPWGEWLENFIVRLKSDISVTKKLEDIGAAAEFLQAAKASDCQGVAELMNEIEKTSRVIYVAYWKERVGRITSVSLSNLNDISTLITESNTFSDEEQHKNIKSIIKLNKYITQATFAELEDSMKHLKSLKNSVADEVYIQILGATQGQYIQFLLRLKALNDKYSNEFTKEINDVKYKIANLEKLSNSYKTKLAVNELKKNEARRLRFIAWAEEQIEKAREFYNDGEKIAAEWSSTTQSHPAQQKYADAWYSLMSIFPADLQYAAPNLFAVYSDWKQKIENRRAPTHEDLKDMTAKYKRISDF